MIRDINDIDKIPVDYHEPIGVRKGYHEAAELHEIKPDDRGISHIMLRELERMSVLLARDASQIRGYRLVDNRLKTLPIGSTLDIKNGTFYWHAGPGFLGEYRFVFVVTRQDGKVGRKNIWVTINPKF